MKKLTIGILLAAFTITFAGCHWRHHHHHFADGYYPAHHAQNHGAGAGDTAHGA